MVDPECTKLKQCLLIYNLTALRVFFRHLTRQWVQVSGFHQNLRFKWTMSQEEHILPEGRCFWSWLTAAAGRETALCGDLRHGVSEERRARGGGSGGQTHPQFILQQEHRSPHLSPKAPSCCSLATAVSPYLSKFHMCSQVQSINSSLLTEQQVQ